MKPRTHLGLALGSLLLAGPLFAAAPAPVFLPARLAPVLAVVKDPPPAGSVMRGRDLDAVVRRQARASDQDLDRARRSADPSLATLFGQPFGPLPDAAVKTWSGLFERVAEDTDRCVGQLKRKFARPRPYACDARIRSLGKPDRAFSYPSGAATIARVHAALLSRLFPELAPALDRRARDIGDCRVILGAHHPTDIEAGDQLGRHLERLIRESPRYQAAVREINASRSTETAPASPPGPGAAPAPSPHAARSPRSGSPASR